MCNDHHQKIMSYNVIKNMTLCATLDLNVLEVDSFIPWEEDLSYFDTTIGLEIECNHVPTNFLHHLMHEK